MRLIDADKLNEYFHIGKNCNNCEYDYYRDCRYQSLSREDICTAIEEAPTLPEMNEPKPKWHVFHKCELTEEEKQEHPTCEWIMRVDCTPSHGEEFLLYTKDCREIFLDHWDDDMWAEYACTMDGTPLDDGDAWMELPKPPKEEQE